MDGRRGRKRKGEAAAAVGLQEGPGDAMRRVLASEEDHGSFTVPQLAEVVLHACHMYFRVDTGEDDEIDSLVCSANSDTTVVSSQSAYLLADRSKAQKGNVKQFSLLWKSDAIHGLNRDEQQRLLGILSRMSTCSRLSIRHTCVFAIFAITQRCISDLVQTRKKLEVVERRINAEGKKKRPNASKLEGLKKDEVQLQGGIQFYEGVVAFAFAEVFSARFKDVHAVIREICIAELGHWILNLPNLVDPDYLKYLGWALNDTAPTARLAAVHALHQIYAGIDITRAMLLFHDRFSTRIMQLKNDVDSRVVIAALDFVTLVLQKTDLDLDEEQLDDIPLLLWDANQLVRRAAARHVYESAFAAETEETSKDSVAQEQFRALVHLFKECSPSSIQAIEDRASIFVDSIWAVFPCLKSWRALFACVEDSKKGDEKSQTAVLTIVNSIVERFCDSGVSKRDVASYDQLVQVVSATITSLLTSFQSEEKLVILLFRILQCVGGAAGNLGNLNTKELLQQSMKLYFMHTDAAVLDEIALYLGQLQDAEGTSQDDVKQTCFDIASEICRGLGSEKEHELAISLRRGRCLITKNDTSLLLDQGEHVADILTADVNATTPEIAIEAIHFLTAAAFWIAKATHEKDVIPEYEALMQRISNTILLSLDSSSWIISQAAFMALSDILVLLGPNPSMRKTLFDARLRYELFLELHVVQDCSKHPETPIPSAMLAAVCKIVLSDRHAYEKVAALLLTCIARFGSDADEVLKAFMVRLKSVDIGFLLRAQLCALQILWEKTHGEQGHVKDSATRFMMSYGVEGHRMLFQEFFRIAVDFALQSPRENKGFLLAAITPFLTRSSATNTMETLKYIGTLSEDDKESIRTFIQFCENRMST